MSRPEPSLVSRIRSGMEVRSSDGVSLGKVTDVWCGKDPKDSSEECDEGVCSRLEVRPSSGLRARLLQRTKAADSGPVLYIPCGAVDGVAKGRVTLAVHAATARAWTDEPFWIRKARGGLGSPAFAGGAHDAVRFCDGSGGGYVISTAANPDAGDVHPSRLPPGR